MTEDEKQEHLKELILQAKAGDDSAFEEVYTLYYTPLYRYILVRIKNKQEAEDIAQTVLMKIWGAIQTWDSKHTSAIAFFFTVARNTLIDYFRKSSRKEIVSDEIVSIYAEEGAGVDEESNSRELREVLSQATTQLSEEQQEIITLLYTNDLTYKEIATITGKREDAIRQLHSRAIKKLREIYKY
ncbi:MAG: RNA polymerase sigma factor [Patescibacteria group bacterium]